MKVSRIFEWKKQKVTVILLCTNYSSVPYHCLIFSFQRSFVATARATLQCSGINAPVGRYQRLEATHRISNSLDH